MLSVSIFLSSIDSHSASQLFSMHCRLVDRQKIDRFGRLEKPRHVPGFFQNMRLAIIDPQARNDMAFTVVGPVLRRGSRRPSQGGFSVIGSSAFLSSLSDAKTLNAPKERTCCGSELRRSLIRVVRCSYVGIADIPCKAEALSRSADAST